MQTGDGELKAALCVRASSPQIGEAAKGHGPRNLGREKEKRGKERKAELF
jgi:hypothetical protein